MKTKLQLSQKTAIKSILMYSATGIVAALLIGIGAFFYFNVGTTAVSVAAMEAGGPPIIRSKDEGGKWNNPGSWDITPARIPRDGDRVIIESGAVITVDQDTKFDGDIIVNGEFQVLNARLAMDEDSRVAVNVGGLISFSSTKVKVIWEFWIIPVRYDEPTGYITIGGSEGDQKKYPWYFPHGSGGTIVVETTQGEAHFGPDAASLLPIELLTFNAEMTKAGDVTITWSTASEKDNDFFTIERSLDGQNFFVLDTLDGAGNSNTVKNYAYTDASPVAGYNYYRLKQTDYDGKFEYFDMVTVVNDKAKPELSLISIGPNPYRDRFEVNFYSVDNNAVHLKLLDMKGKTIFSKSIEAEKGLNAYTYVDQHNLQPGIYLFTIVQKGTPAKTFRIVKSS